MPKKAASSTKVSTTPSPLRTGGRGSSHPLWVAAAGILIICVIVGLFVWLEIEPDD